MKYFRLREPEYIVIQELYGQTSYSALKALLTVKFPESTIQMEMVQHLVVNFHRNGLLVSDATGQAKPLVKKRNKELQQKAVGLLSSIISIRFPGYDPERLLNWIYPKCRWFFTTWFTFVVVATCLAAVTLVLSNLEEFYSKLPDFQSFFAVDNILFMGFILIFTKTIHEFGHGLMCKHFGGECHEIGFMFLVLMPAMYCNTSDSWILPNRWHRIAIGAAGMYVEIFMAAVCTFIWWFTHPCWLHYFCLNLMFISSFSTIVFNLNPLLRYDGYYMLSDLLEIPNLSQKSKSAFLSTLRVNLLGMEPINQRQLPQRNIEVFAIYSVLSFVYRWVVMIAIFWFLTQVFEPFGLAPLGHLVIAISLIGMVVVPCFKLCKFFLYPGRTREVKKARLAFTTLALLTLVAFVCFFKFPHYVGANFVLQHKDPQKVMVVQSGNLASLLVKPGDVVEPGQTLAVLENLSMELELEGLNGRLAQLKTDLTGYQLTRNQFLDSNTKIEETIAAIADAEEQIRVKQQQASRLTLVANRAGEVLPPPNQIAQPTQHRLVSWTNSPLYPDNQTAYLKTGAMLCMVGDPDEFQAIFIIDESNLDLLQAGQKTILLFEQYPGQKVYSELTMISQDELMSLPRELSMTNGGPVAVKPDGTESPVLKSFEAKADLNGVELSKQGVHPINGYTGTAKICVGKASIGTQVIRYLRTIINFR